jgi:all-trans-retinol 13,14-reductase
MLPPSARGRFRAPYAKRRLSISLLSATFGLSTRPAEIDFKRYSTSVVPKWMRRLADFRRSGELMAGMPGDAEPRMALVDCSSNDSGLGGPPYAGQRRVSIAGLRRQSFALISGFSLLLI